MRRRIRPLLRRWGLKVLPPRRLSSPDEIPLLQGYERVEQVEERIRRHAA